MNWIDIVLLSVGLVLYVFGIVAKKHAHPSNERPKYVIGLGAGLLACGVIGILI